MFNIPMFLLYILRPLSEYTTSYYSIFYYYSILLLIYDFGHFFFF